MTEPHHPEAYVVRWRNRSLALPFIAVGAIVFALAQTWPPSGFILVVLVISVVGFTLASFKSYRRVYKGDLALVVDQRGVFLGPSDEPKQPVWIPWSEIDAVVYFWRVSRGAESDIRNRYVGIERNGRIVASRIVQGWTLSVARLSQATRYFGQGREVREAPVQHTPDAGLN